MSISDLPTAIVYLLVGVSVLLIGMKLMSTGLKKTVGKNLKKFFRKTQNNPLAGMGIGISVTAVIQASDATSAMVIGFINAGAMTIYQGLCIMLGAYIGTTVTGVLASFSSLPIALYLLLFSFVGVLMMFFKKEILKNIGTIFCGLGLLFFGLATMKVAFAQPDIKSCCETIFGNINFPPLLFLIGVILAALVQSSSAITSIVIAMVAGGSLGLPLALYIVLGATLGTVTNTLLASIGGSTDAKRTAWIAFFLRAVTSLLMMLILVLLQGPIISFLKVFEISGNDALPVAMFTVLYNIIFMPLLIPFLKPTIKLFSKIIKDRQKDNLAKTVHFIDDKLLNTPTIAMMQVKKEIVNMFDLSYQNYDRGFKKAINQGNDSDKEIIQTEDEIDYLNKRITDYLIKLANKVNSNEEKKVGSYFHVINDIERIGDHAYNYYEMAQNMINEELKFSSAAVDELQEMHAIVMEMFLLSKEIFVSKDTTQLTKLHELEEKTDAMKVQFYSNHYERIKQNKCSTELTPYLSSIIVEIERVADHLTNIGYSIVNPTGDDE